MTDTGSGIQPDDLPYIFDRFYQTKAKNRTAQGGTGIGLAFSKKLAELMQGDITAESSPGQGASFIVTLPKVEIVSQTSTEDVRLMQAAETREKTVIPQTTPSEAADQLAPKATILLVEDNDDMRDFIQSLLMDKYHIITAENGEMAVEKLPTANCQLVLSDIMMPIMDGYQLLAYLKSNDEYRHLPVIMLTASGGMDDKLKALRIGVDDYMLKPFNKEELLARIDNLLKNAANRILPEEQEEISDRSPSANEDIAPTLAISQEDQLWLEEVEHTVRENLSAFQFNVAELARMVALSDRQLSRRIKTLTGLSVGNYIREIRFETARRSLENGTAQSVKALAYDVGMKSVKNFSA